MVFDLIKLALSAKHLDALIEFFIDHKKYMKEQGMDKKYVKTIFILSFYNRVSSFIVLLIFFILEGHALGILLRVCWVTYNGDHQSFSLLMDLISVSTVDNEKENRKSAELLNDFIERNGLGKFGGKLSITADHAVAGTFKTYLKEVGLHNLADHLGICNSHSHQNIFKRMLAQILDMIVMDQCKGNFFFIKFSGKNNL